MNLEVNGKGGIFIWINRSVQSPVSHEYLRGAPNSHWGDGEASDTPHDSRGCRGGTARWCWPACSPPVGPPPCLSTPTLCEQQQRAYRGSLTPSVIALSLVKNHKLGIYNIVPFNISKPGFHILSVYIFYMMKINSYVIIIKFTSGW